MSQFDNTEKMLYKVNVGISQQNGFWNMDKEIERIFNRQFERMKRELLDIKMPDGYLTIISKYWDFAKQDIQERIMEDGRNKKRAYLSPN